MINRHFVIAAIVLAGAVAIASAQENQFLGRWNVTGTGANSANVYWLEIKDDGGQLTGMFLNRGGSPVKLASVKVENGELVFQTTPPANGSATEGRARAQGGQLAGTIKTGQRTVEFTGVHPPKWPAADANAPHKLGE